MNTDFNTTWTENEPNELDEAYWCIRRISNWVKDSEAIIKKLDTTNLSPWVFRIHNSWILWILEYQDTKRNQEIETTIMLGFNIIQELFTHPRESALFMRIKRWSMRDDDFSMILSEWTKYFHRLNQEGNIKDWFSLYFSTRYLSSTESYSFILERKKKVNEEE